MLFLVMAYVFTPQMKKICKIIMQSLIFDISPFNSSGFIHATNFLKRL